MGKVKATTTVDIDGQTFEALADEPEQLYERVDITSEPSPLDVFNADPEYDYGWFSKDPNHPQYWRQMEKYGWRLVSAVGGRECNCFGATEYKTLVLMRRKMKLTEEHRRWRKHRTDVMIAKQEKALEDFRENTERLMRDAEKGSTTII